MTTSRGVGSSAISVVVPVYNGEATLRELVTRLESTLGKAVPKWDIILVNDGSQDNSWDVICQLAREHDCLRGINLMRNYGQHNALLCGIRMAENDVVVTLDDDLQHPPEEIPKLLNKLSEGYDVVYGTPQHEQHGFWRDLSSKVTKTALQSTMGAQTARKVSAFRAFNLHLREAFADYQGSFVSLDVLLTWGTKRFAAVPVLHRPRSTGRSNYTFRMLVTHALNMMTGFSTWPLQLASIVGFVFTVFGLGVLAYVLGRYVAQGGGVPGFAFLASIIAIFSGAQLFSLGIIGEYLARVHLRTLDKPPYVVSDTSSRESTR